jgi:hypothetical protein
MSSIGRKNKSRWKDVQSFKISSIRGAKMIAINYWPHYADAKVARAVASGLAGIEAAIPNSYNISLVNLEQVLNEWLERFGRETPIPSIGRTSSDLRPPAAARVER